MLLIVSFRRTTRKTTNIYEHYRHWESPSLSQSQISPIGYDTSGSKRIFALANSISQFSNPLHFRFPVPPLQTIVVQFLSPLSFQQYIGERPLSPSSVIHSFSKNTTELYRLCSPLSQHYFHRMGLLQHAQATVHVPVRKARGQSGIDLACMTPRSSPLYLARR